MAGEAKRQNTNIEKQEKREIKKMEKIRKESTRIQKGPKEVVSWKGSREKDQEEESSEGEQEINVVD